MKKSLFIILVVIFASVFSLKSQVTNYALNLTATSAINSGIVTELNDLTSFTVQFWFIPSSWNTGASIYSRGEGTSSFSTKLGNSNELIFFIGNNSFSVISSLIGANKWAHITFISNKGDIVIYINNTLAKQVTISGLTIPASTSPFLLGVDFAGRIDDFRLWNVALTDPNYYLWRNTVNKYHPNWNNLILYYKFDQNLCVNNIVDYKFNHHGNFVGDASRVAVTDNAKFVYRINSAYTEFCTMV